MAGQWRNLPRRYLAIVLLGVQGTVTVATSQRGCIFPGENGSILTFQPGESVHSYKPSRCSESESFPCICNPEAPNQIECPFCWLSSSDPAMGLLCVNDGDSVTHTNLEGERETCSCSVSTTEFNLFSTDCSPAVVPNAFFRPSSTTENGFGAGIDDLDYFFNQDATTTTTTTNTCTINGETYERGQPLGFSYESGCSGLSFDYQCFCNPDMLDQVECPYCFFDVPGSDDPICLRDGEIATFEEDGTGNTRTCSCSAPEGGTPESNCFVAPESANTCAIQGPDGSIQTFAAGESLLREIPSRCGPSYPCFCEPTIRGQIWCPYCVYAESSESILCKGDGETITYVDMDQQSQTCSCHVPTDRNESPISTCVGGGPSSTGTLPPGTTNGDDLSDVDSENSNTWGACELNGNLFFAGEEVGVNFVTRCGDVQDFPCYCNPDKDPPVDCPYCGFALTKENLLCLKNEQIASFVDINGDAKTCECLAPTISSTPVENCLLTSDESNMCVFRDRNGDPMAYDAGEPVDNSFLPISNCGPNYQCFCDPMASDQLSCPFCVEVDFGGNLLCASKDEFVVYKDETGVDQSCFCDVPSDLGFQKPFINCVDEPPFPPPEFPDSTSFPTLFPDVDPSNSTEATCNVLSPTGEEVVAADGQPFGPELGGGVCGSSTEWPKICNAKGLTEEQQITYPYCIFENTAFGNPSCAKDNGSVKYLDSNQQAVECSCTLGNVPPSSCSGGVVETPNSQDGAVNHSRSSGCLLPLISLIMGVFYAFI